MIENRVLDVRFLLNQTLAATMRLIPSRASRWLWAEL
jgi:hypothetical protein